MGKRVIEDRSCISDEVLHEQISLAILTATLDDPAITLAMRQRIHDSVFRTIDTIFPHPK